MFRSSQVEMRWTRSEVWRKAKRLSRVAANCGEGGIGDASVLWISKQQLPGSDGSRTCYESIC
jgi:hypothetical protein